MKYPCQDTNEKLLALEDGGAGLLRPLLINGDENVLHVTEGEDVNL